jgi:multiple sugar transport system permease protein
VAVSAPREKLPPTVAARPARRRLTRARAARRARNIALYVILVPGSLLFVAPFAWLVSSSFRSLGSIFAWPPDWIPDDPTLDNYKLFLGVGLDEADARSAEFVTRWFLNSAFVAFSITFLQLFFNSLAAYAFAKRRFPGRDTLFLIFLGTIMIPGQVLLIPSYIILKHMPLFGGNDLFGQGGHGWLDSYWGLIAPGAVSTWGIFWMRQYMKGIPDDLIDAAKIDGASEFRIYRQIILPLSKPALAASAIGTFTYAWNDWFWPLIVTSSDELRVLPLGLALFVTKNRVVWDVLFAGSVLVTLPVIIMFLLFQRQILKASALSGFK